MGIIESGLFIPGRRRFLTKIFPAGALLCLGCRGLAAFPAIGEAKTSGSQTPKYLDDSGMSVEDVYKFAFGYSIPSIQVLARDIGKEKFLEMLTKAQGEVFSGMFASMEGQIPDHGMKSLASIFKTMLGSPPYNKAFEYEVTKDTDSVFELKFTECLPARVCREMNAADIGYALECAPTDIIAKSFNPAMSVENPQSLMKGDSICIERFVLEG